MSGRVQVFNMQDYHTVLDIINLEPKATAFLRLSTDPSTATDIMDSVARLRVPGVALERKEAYNYMNRLLGREELGVAVMSRVQGRRPNSTARAWSLTQKGECLQPAVAFGMTFLPEAYGISAFDVIGAMNSCFQRRGSYARTDILSSLSVNGPQTLMELSGVVGAPPTSAQCKLDDLSGVAFGSARYPEGLPFVEPDVGDKDVDCFVYLWTGKEMDQSDFYGSCGLARPADFFVHSGEGSYHKASDLSRHTDYSHDRGLYAALGKLVDRGYVIRKPSSHFRSYRLTSEGKAFASECF